MNESGIRMIGIEEKEYPDRLRRIPDSPEVLYLIGRFPDENKLTVGIIGARNCSYYGEQVAMELGRRMAENDIQVISGMARGIDGISQRSALMSGGEVFAVLGSGVDICYPKENEDVYELALKKGGIISPYPEGMQPLAKNFPPRNRIISGLSDVLVVVEAGMKSGTMITVDMALEQGKEVYVVPGRITDRLSEGCNYLVAQGANVITSVTVFMNELRVKNGKDIMKSNLAKEKRESGEIENFVLASLNDDPKTIGELWDDMKEKMCACELKLTVPELTELLMKMQINGKIRKEGGKFIILFTNS